MYCKLHFIAKDLKDLPPFDLDFRVGWP